MKLTRDEVLKIAHLARLELGETEAERFGSQLSAILDHIEKLKEIAIDGIEPTAHAMLVPTPFRKDVVVEDTTRERSLENVPDREGNFFKVPKVLA